MNNNNSFDINSGRDTNVSIHQIDYGGLIILQIVKAIIGLIAAIVLSPVLIPMLIAEGRSGKRSQRGCDHE